jgi:flagellin
MSLSIQTNIASLDAQEAIRVNTQFQNNTIEQLSTGYRINSSADDAAGLAVANQYQNNTAVLTQGVLSANNAIAGLQITDGGLSNINTILDRLSTLATESASSTFTGSRTTLNDEYQGLLAEVNRQAANVNLNTGGTYNTNLVTYVGGGNAANSQISVNLSGANNAVDTTGLGIANTSVLGGGSELTNGVTNTVRLDDAATSFLVNGSQVLNFHIGVPGVGGVISDQDVAITVTGGASGLTGTQVVSNLNSSLAQYGITASIASDGTLQLGGSTAFSVNATAGPSGGNAIVTTGAEGLNTANYNVSSFSGAGAAVFADFTGTQSETAVFQNGSGSTTVTLNATTENADNINDALTALNSQLNGTGITAVKDAAGTSISFQSNNIFSVNETAQVITGTGNLFGGVGGVTVTPPASSATGTGNAIQALASLQTAVTNLGLTQGTVGAGINKLNYAVSLAQSQITNFSAAESGIKDANIAAEAANLTKAQVLQQASLAALAQANSAPQAVLSLLKGQ